MAVIISVPALVAYGADGAIPDTARGGNAPWEMALHKAAHEAPRGGIEALAKRMGVSANTLSHKVNPANETHHLRVGEAVDIMSMTGDMAALHAIAAQLGYTCFRALPDQSQGSVSLAFMYAQMAYSDFIRAVAEPLARAEAVGGDAFTTKNEQRRAEAMAADLHSAISHLTAIMRRQLRPAPNQA